MLAAMALPPIAPCAAQDGGAEGPGGSEVELGVIDLGVGGLLRGGDWGAIRVQMTDRAAAQREIILRVSIRDADGDLAQFDRVVSANPGIPQSFWLYAWIPFNGVGHAIEIHALEARDPAGEARGQLAYRAGRLLGSTSVFNPSIQNARLGFIGIIGTRRLGLDGYAISVGNQLSRPGAHELTRLGAGLTTDAIPDRWHGLLAYDALVWGASTLRENDPSTLTPERARAIRAWIERGGHLVIVLPAADDPWYRGEHPLRSLLPRVRVRRIDGASYESIRPLLTESGVFALPENATLHTFEIADAPARMDSEDPLAEAGSGRTVPILRTPEGQTIVAQRLLGAGAVTVVGVDLHNGDLRRLGLPDTEAIWHRVLGMRGASPRLEELSDQRRADASNRTVLEFDTRLSAAIAKTGRAVRGVFFGLVVFALYWCVAGPIGFLILKWRGRAHHAWLGFVLVITVFTIIAWLGATAMRPERVSVTHLSITESVHGQDRARTRSWLSVMLPSYGTSEVALAPGSGAQAEGVLTPWEPGSISGPLVTGFPDNTGYRIEARRPDSIRVPTRATVKQFRADWGGVSGFGGIRPENGSGLRLDGMRVVGSVTHNLVGALADLRIIVVYRQIPILRPGVELGDALIARSTIWSPVLANGSWEPGTPLDLEVVTTPTTTNQGGARDYLRDAVREGIGSAFSGVGGSRGGSITDRLIASRLLSQLEPPNYSTANLGVGDRLASRRQTHGWDLGRWFTRPCVIVLGVLETDERGDALPLPLLVDGREPPASGTTLVSWVYPLEPSPPGYPWLAPPPASGSGEGASP